MTNPVIVVGVDGSDGGRLALEWAIAEAVRRGAVVEAVMAYTWDAFGQLPVAGPLPMEPREVARRSLDAQVDAALAGVVSPPVISREVVEGPAAHVLTHAALDAEFLVVGSRGHGPLRSAILGSVSQACVHKSTRPVVVVPAPHPPPERHDEIVAAPVGLL